jgi:hypothetical protein
VFVQFRDEHPVADSLIFRLHFPAYWVLGRSGTPFEADFRTLDQDVIPEIFRVSTSGLLVGLQVQLTSV